MNQYRKYLITAFGSFLVVLLLGVGWGWAVLGSQQSVEESVLVNNSQSVEALHEFGELNRLFGFGGVIHDFKNYLIRQDAADQERLVQSFRMIRAQETVFRAWLKSPEELAALDQIMSVVNQYQASYLVAQRMIEKGSSIEAINQAVRVSDQPALKAQKTLRELLARRFDNNEAAARQNLEYMDRLVQFGSLLLLPLSMLGVIFLLLFRRMKIILESLEDAKKEVELLLETTPDSVMAIDQQGTVFRANKTAVDYFGYGDALIGKKVEELMPKSARSAHVHLRLDYFISPESRDMAPNRRVKALMASGEVREVAIKLGFFGSLAGPTSVISIRDVTEENRAKGELIDTQKRIDFAASVTRFGIWEWDLENDRLIWDRWTHHLHGTEAGSFSARYQDWLALLHSEDRHDVNARIQHGIATANPIESEYRVVMPDGETHYLRLSAGVQSDDEGHVLRVTGVSRDITVTREAQQAMEEARSQAIAANEVKSQFLANMSHEIRTPMNAVLGLLTLLDNSELAEHQKQLVMNAHTSAKSLLEILNDILDFSKLEVGKVDIANSPFELDDVLGKNVDLYSVMAASKDVSFYLKIEPDVFCSLVGDSLRLNQVLGNLLSNAIKFTRGGSVTLAVSNVETNPQDCLLRFSVQDTGIGMTDAQLKRARAPFGQADMSTTRNFGGTGLGLPICDSLLALMGSELTINSLPEQGTEISFVLRFGLVADSKRHSDLPANNTEVLMVFHDPRLRELVEQTILPWARDRICTRDFTSALDVIDDSSRDIQFLLTDYSNEKQGDAFETLCRKWVGSRSMNSDNVVLIHKGYSDPLSGLEIPSFNPNVVASPPTPSRLYNAMNRRKLNRSMQSSPGGAVGEAIGKTSALRGSHILVVEDVVTNQIIATNFLKLLGMRVDVANDGIEALERVKADTYDGVLMDFHMPGMNGLETTREMRKIPALKQMPIIAMTAAAFDQDRARALAVGMNAYLSKPLDINQLADVLVQSLPIPAATGEHEGQNLVASEQPAEKRLDVDSLPVNVNTEMVMFHFNADLRFYHKCLRAFVEDFSNWTHNIDVAVQQADVVKVKALLHKLKGTAANIGAKKLANLVSEVELSEGIQSINGLATLQQQLLEFLKDIQQKIPEREGATYYGNVDAGAGLDACLDSLKELRESLDNQRYIPSDVLDARLSMIPVCVSYELVSDLQKNVEMFDYVQARHCLKRILESVQQEMAKK
ncbi:MAG: response regulator [Marinobacter sp.]